MMPRNIVICCDGTANEFGTNNTNVVRLAQVLERDTDAQMIYYDPGVGTLPEPGFFTRIGKKIATWVDLAFATTLKWKVGMAYAYLMSTWQPGDRVFLFGFSRGAYTVRVLAAMLHEIGLLPHGNQMLIPYAIRLFRAARTPGSKYDNLAGAFRESFARETSEGDRRFPIHFVGVWDTVSSVGWVWDQATYPFTRYNPSIATIRQAISLDERRAFFRQNRFSRASAEQDFAQLWFAGVHSDIGGGYPDGNLWRCTLDWMLDEAIAKGLIVNDDCRRRLLPEVPEPWASTAHESLTAAWWPCEIFPKWHWNDKKRRHEIRLNLGRRRTINDGELLHSSTLWRIKKTDYNPPNLSESFRKKVREMTDVPAAMAYESTTPAGAPAPH
jgi:uncharacterized protein (DUF2235 family)